jgi:hydroxylamine reductase (hybrid-cluster protein)
MALVAIPPVLACGSCYDLNRTVERYFVQQTVAEAMNMPFGHDA